MCISRSTAVGSSTWCFADRSFAANVTADESTDKSVTSKIIQKTTDVYHGTAELSTAIFGYDLQLDLGLLKLVFGEFTLSFEFFELLRYHMIEIILDHGRITIIIKCGLACLVSVCVILLDRRG